MGSGLGSGYTEGSAKLTNETPPLWGMGLSEDAQKEELFLNARW
jgi:CxxC motif-containing protein (DUF1111 family)